MRLALALSVAALLALPLPVLAEETEGPPPMTIDRPSLGTASQTVGDGVVQLEAGYSYTSDRESGVGSHSVPLTLRVGVGDDLEFRVDGAASPWAGEFSGMEDPVPGVKWTFARSEKASYGLLANVEVPVGAAALRSNRLLPGLLFLADWDLGGDTSLNFNVGGFGIEDPETATMLVQPFAAAGLGHQFNDLVSGYVELAALGREGIGLPNQAVADAGMAFQVGPDTAIDFAVFRGLSSTGTGWGGAVGFAQRW